MLNSSINYLCTVEESSNEFTDSLKMKNLLIVLAMSASMGMGAQTSYYSSYEVKPSDPAPRVNVKLLTRRSQTYQREERSEPTYRREVRSEPTYRREERSTLNLNPEYFSDTRSEVYPYLVYFRYEGYKKMFLYSYYGERYSIESSHSIYVYSKADLVSKNEYDEAMLEDAKSFYNLFGVYPNTDLEADRTILRSLREHKQNN